MLIATAGHIDHGKTSLIRALTGAETDRLPEEQRRGISIDLGFAYWQPDDGPVIGFVDVPGHERFVRNMIAGLSGVRHALLAVAADDGVMPQTREHVEILSLLGFDRLTVALTKADRVDAGQIAAARASVADFLELTPFAGAPAFPVAAPTGEGIGELAAALLAARTDTALDAAHGFRLAIDRAFSIAGAGTVVTGTVIAGQAKVGDRLTISPSGREVRVRGMQSGGEPVQSISAGHRCAVNLSGVERTELHRGNWLVSPVGHTPTTRIEARIALSASRQTTLRHDSRIHLHLGTGATGARILVPGQRSVAPGTTATVHLALDTPTLAVIGERFILRDQSGHALAGGGMVLDPLAETRRRPAADRDLRAAALAIADPAERLAALAAAPGIEPDISWFARSSNLTAEAMANVIDRAQVALAGKSRTIAATPGRLAQLEEALLAALQQHHGANPAEAGLALSKARTALNVPLSADLFGNLVQRLAAAGKIEAQGTLLRLPGHSSGFSPAETEFWRRALAIVEDRPPQPIALGELARELRIGEATLLAVLMRRRASGDVWQVTESRFMLREHVASLVSLAARLDRVGGTGFTVSAFRDASGLGRNFVIQLLEFFDRIGVTRRQGDVRRMKASWQLVIGSAADQAT